MGIARPHKLSRADDRSSFISGAEDLDEWLREYAWQNQQGNTATTYVTTVESRVVGYYAIAMSAYAREEVPRPIARGAPRQVPCILLARLAIDRELQGQGWGADLLRDALLRAVGLSGSIGAAAVLVHCRDESAREFYLRHAEFLPSPVDDMHLLLPMKVLRRYVEE